MRTGLSPRRNSRAQMLRVAGVGERKMERYGDAFLQEIAEYEEDAQ